MPGDQRLAARRLQPRGLSTRSLVVPSGNANGARTPVCATASGKHQRPEARRRRRARPAGPTGANGGPGSRPVRSTARSPSRSCRGRRRAARSRTRCPPVRRAARAATGPPTRTTRDRRPRASGRRRPGRARRRDRRAPRRTPRCRPTTVRAGPRSGVPPTDPSPLTMNGSARRGTSKSVTWSSGRPARANAAQYQATRSDDPVPGDQAERSVGRPRGEHPLLDRRVGMTGILEAGIVERRSSSGRPHVRQTREP